MCGFTETAAAPVVPKSKKYRKDKRTVQRSRRLASLAVVPAAYSSACVRGTTWRTARASMGHR